MTPVLFENEDLIAIHKDSGVSSLPYTEEELQTTAAGVAVRFYPKLVELGLERDFGALHRLDQGTSGVLLFAKNTKTHDHYRELWKTDSVSKIYRALTAPPLHPAPEITPFQIDTPIGHDEKSAKKMRAILEEKDLKRIRGKPQTAQSEVIQVINLNRDHDSMPEHLQDWTIRIKTGVRHQIRVHLSSLGAPILGDTLYRGLASSRLWLHSWKLEIEGKLGSKLLITAPLPEHWPL